MTDTITVKQIRQVAIALAFEDYLTGPKAIRRPSVHDIEPMSKEYWNRIRGALKKEWTNLARVALITYETNK